MNNLEIIKNIAFSLASLAIFIGSVIFYIKIYFNSNKIRDINIRIESIQTNIDKMDLEEMSPLVMDRSLFHAVQKRELEHQVLKLQREKNNLLEEISIYKIFKK